MSEPAHEETYRLEREPCPVCRHPLSLEIPLSRLPNGARCPSCGAGLMILDGGALKRALILTSELGGALFGSAIALTVYLFTLYVVTAPLLIPGMLHIEGLNLTMLALFTPVGGWLTYGVVHRPLRVLRTARRGRKLLAYARHDFALLDELRDETPEREIERVDLTHERCVHCGVALSCQLRRAWARRGFACPWCQGEMRLIEGWRERGAALLVLLTLSALLLVFSLLFAFATLTYFDYFSRMGDGRALIGIALTAGACAVALSGRQLWRFARLALRPRGLLPATFDEGLGSAPYKLTTRVTRRPLKRLRREDEPLEGAVSLSDGEGEALRGAISEEARQGGEVSLTGE